MMIDRTRLYRDPSRGWIAGVAAGLADGFGVNAGVIRLVFVLLALTGTPVAALILYVLLCLFVPVRRYQPESSFSRRWRQGY